jgi:hypothetical protein
MHYPVKMIQKTLQCFFVSISLLAFMNGHAVEITSVVQTDNIISINVNGINNVNNITGFKLNGQDVTDFFTGANSNHDGYKIYYIIENDTLVAIDIKTDSPLNLSGLFEIDTDNETLKFDLSNAVSNAEISQPIDENILSADTRNTRSRNNGNRVVVYGTAYYTSYEYKNGDWFGHCKRSKANGAFVQISRNGKRLGYDYADDYGHYVISFNNNGYSSQASITAKKYGINSYKSKSFGTRSSMYGYNIDSKIYEKGCN